MTRYLRRSPGMWMLVLLLPCGCESGAGSVSGTMMYQGATVPSGTVSFFIQGKVFEAEIQDGRYQITGVPPGEASVTVIRLDPDQPDPLDAIKQARKNSAENKTTSADPTGISDPRQLDLLQKNRHLLPYRYSALATTDLRCTVATGANSFDIELQDQPTSK